MKYHIHVIILGFFLLSLFHYCVTQVCLPVVCVCVCVFSFCFSRSLPVCPSMLVWCHSSSSSPCLLRFTGASNFTFDLVADFECPEGFVVFHLSCVLPKWALERLPLIIFTINIEILQAKRNSIFLEYLI